MVIRDEIADAGELRRRRRERIIIAVTIVTIILLSLLESYLARQEMVLPISSSVIIFGLININIILIILLIFLIVRNVVKLIYDQRAGAYGAKFRTKLVLAFVGFSLIPTVVLFFFAVNFLSYSIENWFSIKMGDALSNSLEVAQTYYEDTALEAKHFARQLSSDITANRLYEQERGEYLRTLMEQRRQTYKLGSIEVQITHQKRRWLFQDPKSLHLEMSPPAPSPKMIEELYSGRDVSSVQSVAGGDLISSIVPIVSYVSSDQVVGTVAVSYLIPPGLTGKINTISQATEEYKQLKLFKNPIKFSYIVTLSIITLLIIFSASWFGLYLARGITGTIGYLAEATGKVAGGDLDYQVRMEAKDELGAFVDSFNKMTRELKKRNVELTLAYGDLEGRKKYTETVLRNVSAGVVSVNQTGVITTINRAAERMFDIQAELVAGKRYDEVLAPEHLDLIGQMLTEMRANGLLSIEKQIQLILKDRAMTILLTANIITDEEGNYQGLALVIEDLTRIQKEERTAAWREVARRLAHEIKNPLTPVQLSAQRLQRRYAEKLGEDKEVFQECITTIIKQVDVLKNLVNEFTRYARMPETRLEIGNLNEVIKESGSLFKDAHREIAFSLSQDPEVPLMNIDPEQMKRVMVNLLDNSVAAISNSDGLIEIRTIYDRADRKVKIEVADNGRGVSPLNKAKMFEPYFSTKKSGMGLGLAIVSSVVADHSGRISVRDNIPRGTVITVELPVPEPVQTAGVE